jgi:hypothetical protein
MASSSACDFSYPQKSFQRGLRLALPDPEVPLEISGRIFSQMDTHSKGKPLTFSKVEVLPSDPEWGFVWLHFHHDKPTKHRIGRVYCVYQGHKQRVFEQNLQSIEDEATTFPPTWDQEPRADQRAEVIQRWNEATREFFPFKTQETGKRRSWQAVRLLPMWHGSSPSACDAISKTGFMFFGRPKIGSSDTVAPGATDDGYFGRGIYFTNSARYAALYSRGAVMMAWTATRTPFPVVGDTLQQDMKQLRGGGHHKDYNAHYIPVRPLEMNADCVEYYPANSGSSPVCDELVVFQKSQALPRFWVELAVDELSLMQVSAKAPKHVEDLIPHLMQLLEQPIVYEDKKARNMLNIVLEQLMQLPGDDYLEGSDYEELYSKLKQLIVGGKVNKVVAQELSQFIRSPSQDTADSRIASGENEDLVLSKDHPLVASSPTVSVPKMAFGAEKWRKYFGDVGEEPPLPANIDEVLSSYCPFWPGKLVRETHFLTLIPASVDGKPFSLDLLGDLIKKPKEGGHSTQYDFYGVRDQLGQESLDKSYWVLMTRNVLRCTRRKTFKKQCETLEQQSRGLPYGSPRIIEAATTILMEHIDTGAYPFDREILTYTRCRDGMPYESHCIAGGFGKSGLVLNRDHENFLITTPPYELEDEITGSTDNYGLAGCRQLLTSGKAPILEPTVTSSQAFASLPKIAFGAEKWRKYFGEVGEEPPLPWEIGEILSSECPFWRGKRVEETHFLTLIPSMVNGERFCLDLLGKLIENPKGDGHATNYKNYWINDSARKNPINQPSYWLLMTKDVLDGTRGIWHATDVVDKRIKELPYRLPDMIEIATSILMEHVKSGSYPFGQNPLTHSYSSYGDRDLIVALGGFGPLGLEICSKKNASCGVASVREL